MTIWIIEYDNGEGGTWQTIYGTRKECLEQSRYEFYGHRYKDKLEFHEALVDSNTSQGDYCIYKEDSYYTGA